MQIRAFRSGDEEAVVALWERCALTRPWNDPRKDIARKRKVDADLFLVGVIDERIVASAMGGYEGHRGWVNYLAVDPDLQRRGFGARMMAAIEDALRSRGCPKINLQIRGSNKAAAGFYRALGYSLDDVISMGKRLERDD
jgi:ribosomal protein S18 acetylase RimI-like enzyme